MTVFDRIAEARIQEAIDQGRFEHLALAGRRLDLSAWERVPAELRGAYSIVKGAGFLPEEMELRKSIASLRDLLDACCDPGERRDLQGRLSSQQLRYDLLMERRGRTLASGDYRARVLRRLG